jgi:hypothetical protein
LLLLLGSRSWLFNLFHSFSLFVESLMVVVFANLGESVCLVSVKSWPFAIFFFFDEDGLLSAAIFHLLMVYGMYV